ncbi:kinase-like domain-containing protein [Syncephalis plumigaleata]|nr:kinase-like domain-containing protein [Syncephalis plumigaleata]
MSSMKLFLVLVTFWTATLIGDHIYTNAINTPGKAIRSPSSLNTHNQSGQEPDVSAVDKLVFTKWHGKNKPGVYTSRVTYDNKSAFLKCMAKQTSYNRERDVIGRVKQGRIVLKNKECARLRNPTQYFLEHYHNFPTSNGYFCIIMSTSPDLKDLQQYTETVELDMLYKFANPILYQLLTSVSYLHCIGVAHTDIKLENVLISVSRNNVPMIKLIDFDGARYLSNGLVQPMPYRTLSFAGPEAFLRKNQEEAFHNPAMVNLIKADSWSIAATMYAFITDFSPYGEGFRPDGVIDSIGYKATRDIFMKAVAEDKHQCLPIIIPPQYRRFAMKCGMDRFIEFIDDLMPLEPNNRLSPLRLLAYKVDDYINGF